MYTQEELKIWKERAKNGPFKNENDAFPGSPGEWDRIQGEAESFLSSSDLFKRTDAGSASEAEGKELRSQHYNKLMSAAFVDLVLGASKYTPKIKTELLRQAKEPTSDFSNRKLYPVNDISDYVWNYAEWQVKLLRAYSYIKDSFSDAETAIMQKWFVDGAEWHKGIIDGNVGQLFNNERGIPVEDYKFNDHYRQFTKSTHKNGHNVYLYGNVYNNRRTAQVNFVTQVGVVFNNDIYKEVGATVYKEWLAFWWYPDGYFAEMHRGSNSMPNGPSSGIAYGTGTMTNMVDIAQSLYHNDFENLFEYKTSVYINEQGILTKGDVVKTLEWTLLKYRENFMDKDSPKIYPNGAGETSDMIIHFCLSTNETTRNQVIRMYSSAAMSNQYYNNPLIADMYEGGNICGVTDNIYLRHGPQGTVPGFLFMYAGVRIPDEEDPVEEPTEEDVLISVHNELNKAIQSAINTGTGKSIVRKGNYEVRIVNGIITIFQPNIEVK